MSRPLTKQDRERICADARAYPGCDLLLYEATVADLEQRLAVAERERDEWKATVDYQRDAIQAAVDGESAAKENLAKAVALVQSWIANSQWTDGTCAECGKRVTGFGDDHCNTHGLLIRTRSALSRIGAGKEG